LGQTDHSLSHTLERVAAAVVGGVLLVGGEGMLASLVPGALPCTVVSSGRSFEWLVSNDRNSHRVDAYLRQIIPGVVTCFCRLRRQSA
jgi:ribose/xylose/arabinose/galactoside ABC-type transport system permease subunit